jgi:hypothetical protein
MDLTNIQTCIDDNKEEIPDFIYLELSNLCMKQHNNKEKSDSYYKIKYIYQHVTKMEDRRFKYKINNKEYEEIIQIPSKYIKIAQDTMTQTKIIIDHASNQCCTCSTSQIINRLVKHKEYSRIYMPQNRREPCECECDCSHCLDNNHLDIVGQIIIIDIKDLDEEDEDLEENVTMRVEESKE